MESIQANVHLIKTEIKNKNSVNIKSKNKNSENFHIVLTLPNSSYDISKLNDGDIIFLTGTNKIAKYSYDKTHKTHDAIINNITYPFSDLDYFEKVITSTDKTYSKYNIPHSFIDKIVEYYNSGNKIETINLELDYNNSYHQDFGTLKVNEFKELFIIDSKNIVAIIKDNTLGFIFDTNSHSAVKCFMNNIHISDYTLYLEEDKPEGIYTYVKVKEIKDTEGLFEKYEFTL